MLLSVEKDESLVDFSVSKWDRRLIAGWQIGEGSGVTGDEVGRGR